MKQLDRFEELLVNHKRQVTWWLVGLVFITLNLFMAFALRQPPVWDGAMSVYPAAIELARTDFDFARLLSLPTYAEGGPNTHATSPWTVLAAVLISVTGSLAKALPILHMISFGLSALTVGGAYRLIAHSAPGIVAVLGAVAVLLFPPMVVQTAEIYLDLPIACLGTWALALVLERRVVTASVLTTLAVWVKPLAVIFVAASALFLLSQNNARRGVARVIVLSAPALVVAGLITALQGSDSTPPRLADRYVISVGGTIQLLQAMPDLIAIFIATLVLAVILINRRMKPEIFTLMTLLLISATLFVLLNPIISAGIPMLPRYYIAILPAVVAAILTVLHSTSRPLALAAASGLIAAFVFNLGGAIYPYKDHATHALAERSLAYRDLLALQIEDVRLLAGLSNAMPVYYDYFGFYRYEYELGYSNGPVESGISVFHTPELADASLADLPVRFAFIYEYPVLGGEVLLRIWEDAKGSGAQVTETALERGTYTVYVVEVDQSGLVDP